MTRYCSQKFLLKKFRELRQKEVISVLSECLPSNILHPTSNILQPTSYIYTKSIFRPTDKFPNVMRSHKPTHYTHTYTHTYTLHSNLHITHIPTHYTQADVHLSCLQLHESLLYMINWDLHRFIGILLAHIIPYHARTPRLKTVLSNLGYVSDEQVTIGDKT